MKIVGVFESGEDWHLEDGNGRYLEGTLNPVAHLVASLVGCAGLTLRALLDKMRIEHGEIVIEGSGVIADETPSFVRSISLEVVASGAHMNDSQFLRVLEMTEKYCLIAQTLQRGLELSISMKETA